MCGVVTDHPDTIWPLSLFRLGWSDFFEDQRESGEAALGPRRIAEVHRARLTAVSETGPVKLTLPVHANTGDFAVGDWVLVDPETETLRRRLKRRTVLERHPEGGGLPQLAAANVDTLFIVTSCNAEFNLSRLERYLALANQGGLDSVVLLTKADSAADADAYTLQAAKLQRGLTVLTLDPRLAGAANVLAPWCGRRADGGAGRVLGRGQIDTGQYAGRYASGVAPTDRTDPRPRCQGTAYDDATVPSWHCGRRLGDRHPRHAHAARRRSGSRHRDPVL